MKKMAFNSLTALLTVVCSGVVYAGGHESSSWDGFYAGGVIGGIWANNKVVWNPLPSTTDFGSQAVSGNTDNSNFLGGLLVGYNYRLKSAWLAGVEGEWIWTNAKGNLFSAPWLTPTNTVTAPGSYTSMDTDVNWMPSIRGRIGMFVKPNVLLFGAAGVSWANVDYAASNINGFSGDGSYATSTRFTKTSLGYTVGAGVEWEALHNILVRAEYLFYQFNSNQNSTAQDSTGNFPTYPSNYVWKNLSANTVRVGLVYNY